MPIAQPDYKETDQDTPIDVYPLEDNGSGPDEDSENEPLTVVNVGWK